ncbi:MAG TPA: penicillin-binding protein 2 [Tessaracoccus flavescens]|uniref:Penicillin-binding protein 2 n=1 Tax=Tessaracoccus flavescens TaxID=399497 RepID=A0A921JR41_9ACTN|nr:penicillin-binding protein 2 [Tessaracoccus flavescens]
MNGPIRKVATFVSLLMAMLLLNLTVISTVRTESLNEDPRNRRVRDAEFSRNRGAILVGNQPISQSIERSGRFPYIRSYPNPEIWAPVTGWYSYDYARSGLEQSFNAELAGTSSEQSVGRIVDVLTGRRSQGANISTTLHAGAQQAAMRALGEMRGAAVAMNYETGEILALASTPSYDPNELSTVDLTAEREAWDRLLNAKDEPLKNRATREVYPPGSTFKLITAAAALEDGLVPSSMVDSPASLRLPNSSRSMGNSTNCGGTRVTLEQALKTSCNTAFGNLGISLGGEKLQAMAEKFGFNQEQSIDIAAATSRFPAELDQAQAALTAIGQFDVAASPLQMVQVAAAIANDGVMMKPYLVSTVTNKDLTVLSAASPSRLGQPISRSTAELLQQMMVATVEDGTGRPAQIDGVVLGGKTGTAQSAPDRPPYAWFVGYAEDPKVAVVAFVENADIERNDISGGRLAAPIFKAIVEALR